MRFPRFRFTAVADTRPSWLPAAPEGKEGLMLILTRKIDQGIVISGDIHIRVLGVERDRVKIGIAAPRDVIVLRDELVDGEKKRSSETSGKLNSHGKNPALPRGHSPGDSAGDDG